jgi:predicted cation transporter
VDFAILADLIILLLVLVLPLVSRGVERNLEAFLFVMGAMAAWAAGALSARLIRDAVTHPIPITVAVFTSGLLFKWARPHIGDALIRLQSVAPLPVLLALLLTALALLSSIITAIIASLVLVEMIGAVRIHADDQARLVVVACMAIGLGAALTPIGEPLSTIATAKLHQDFWFLMRTLGPWIVPGIVVLGASIAVLPLRSTGPMLTDRGEAETYRGVLARAARVFLFVMALVLLGEGFKPVIDRFVLALDARWLYWINTVSAILDNATLTAAEISPQMHLDQVRAVLMSLLISGGMLIPGNIPNIIAAHRLGIHSRTWARWGIPLGVRLLVAYFILLWL